MNVLEHYIKEVYSVDDISNKFEEFVGYPPKEPMLRIRMRVDCYGVEEDTEYTLFKSEWEEAKQKGYYIA